MGCLVNNIPAYEVVGELGQIPLLALPLVIATNADATADDDKRDVRGLDVASARDFVLGQRLGDEVLLELSLDVLAALVGGATVDTIFASASVEDGAKATLDTKRRDDTKAPQDEATVGTADAVKEILVKRVNHHDTSNVADMAGREDARDNGAIAGRNQDEGTLLTSDSQSFGQGVCGHASAVRAGGAVRPGVARAVPVTVAVNGAVLPGSVCPVLKIIFRRDLAGLKQKGRVGRAVGAVSDVAQTCKVNLVLVAVDVVTLAVHGQGGIASAQYKSGGHEDSNDGKHDHDQSGYQNGKPLAQCPASLRATSEALFFLALAPSHDSVGKDAPQGDECGPGDRGNTRPTLFDPQAGHGEDQDEVDGQDTSDDSHRDAHGLGGIGEEEDGDQKVTGGQGGVGKVEEARTSGMKAWRRDEDAHKEQDPPDKVDEEEEDGDVAQEANGPEIVG